MRVFTFALALWATGVANGTNPCLNPDHQSYQCSSGTTSISLTDYSCGNGWTDPGIEDLVSCFDNTGRTSVTSISLESIASTTLPAGLFDGFNNLELLTIRETSLLTLPLGIFDGLDSGSLFYLALMDNQFTSLPAGLFDGLDAVENLHLSGNQLVSLPAGVFDGLDVVRYISLQDNQLISLPVGLFDGLDDLQSFNLYGNQLASLPVGLFDGLDTLRFLSLNDNRLASLPAGIFDGLGELKYLNLEDNDELQCLPSLTGSPLLTDDELYLPDGFEDGGICSCPSVGDDGACESDEFCTPSTDGYICDIEPNSCLDPEHSLYGCEAGNIEIYLDHCGIADEDLEDLAKCFDNAGRSSVTVLHLLGNDLTILPSGLFDGLYALKVLSLSDNALVVLPAGIFDDLGALQSLYLQQNSLSVLRAGLFDDLESLTQLTLEDNTDLQCLPSLIGSPLLTDDELYLPDGFEDGGVCSCPSLGDDGACEFDESCDPGTDGYTCSTRTNPCLNPDHQSYKCSSGTTSIILTEYFCGDGWTDPGIEDVVWCFDNTGRTSVISISLESIASTTLPAGLFDGFNNLRTLTINDTPLTTLPLGAFDGLDSDSFYYLHLSGNQLVSLPVGVFDGLDVLQSIKLDDNQLASLPVGLFDGLDTLQFLSLNDNQLVSLPVGLFDGLTALEYLNLEGNDELQCFPAISGSARLRDESLYLPDDVEDGSICSCPSLEDDGACESNESCAPGTDGYICTARVRNSCFDPEYDLYGCEPGSTLIDLDNCGIEDEDLEDLIECFDNVGRTSVTTISMNSNSLTELPGGENGIFTGFDSLISLMLNQNNIETLYADSFKGLGGSLTSLSIIQSRLTTIPVGCFDNLVGLQSMRLYGNDLAWLPVGAFRGLGALQTLQLAGNDLSTLPAGLFDGLESLTSSLDLSENEDLQCVPSLAGSPNYSAYEWNLPEGFGDGGTCSCPTSGDDGACESDESCSPGTDGYICSTGQSDIPSYLGCFSDPADNRVFELTTSTAAMTAEVCSDLCSDSAFYGTQYSTECWCGDNVEYAVNGPGVCDMSCSGDSDEICGGSYALSLYANEPKHLGCYSDPADNRIFERVASSVDMTAEVCLGHCGKYQYYGTQYSMECWCGDNADYGANSAGECDMACSGDSAEVCGGSYSMSVYKNFDVDAAVTSYHIGCYSDPAENRVFVQNESSDAMTAELCATRCTGSAFFGTQYSTECWCGDINAPYSVNGEGVCDMTCSGNPEESCGGSYSMDVYAHDPSYLGCFSDPDDRRIFVRERSTSAMTAATCATLCTGSAYYGTQYSQECWCGDNASYDANGFGVCDKSCSGNPDEMCGGSYTMSVYQDI